MTGILAFVLAAIGSHSAWAQDPPAAKMRVDDAKGILARTDAFIGDVDFEKALRCGDWSDFEMNDCTYECKDTVCTESCKTQEARDEIVGCSETEVKIRRRLGRDPERTAVFSKAEYKEAHGNMLRLFLNMIEAGKLPPFPGFSGRIGPKDYVVIDNAKEASETLPSGQVIPNTIDVGFTLYVWFEDHQQHFSVPFYLILGKNLPALAQLVRFGFHDKSLKPAAKLLAFGRILSFE
jgi:hypothetical protein